MTSLSSVGSQVPCAARWEPPGLREANPLHPGHSKAVAPDGSAMDVVQQGRRDSGALSRGHKKSLSIASPHPSTQGFGGAQEWGWWNCWLVPSPHETVVQEPGRLFMVTAVEKPLLSNLRENLFPGPYGSPLRVAEGLWGCTGLACGRL